MFLSYFLYQALFKHYCWILWDQQHTSVSWLRAKVDWKIGNTHKHSEFLLKKIFPSKPTCRPRPIQMCLRRAAGPVGGRGRGDAGSVDVRSAWSHKTQKNSWHTDSRPPANRVDSEQRQTGIWRPKQKKVEVRSSAASWLMLLCIFHLRLCLRSNAMQ